MTTELMGSRIRQADYQSLRFALDRCENGNRREKTDAKSYLYQHMEETASELLKLHREKAKDAEQMASMSMELLRMRDMLGNFSSQLSVLRDEAHESDNYGGAHAYDFALQEIEEILEGDWTI